MNLELLQDGFGALALSVPPENFGQLIHPDAYPLFCESPDFTMLLEEFRGEGFSAWFSRYRMLRPVVLRARGDIATLELRIALKNRIGGEWDKIAAPELPVYYFQMGFVPHVLTRAVFAAPAEYQTFDIHFSIDYLNSFGIEYTALDHFLTQVINGHPAELSAHPHRCTPLMTESIHHILNNRFTVAGKARLLQNCVSNILIGALETVGVPAAIPLRLSDSDIEALHYVKHLIDKHFPDYLSNTLLVRLAKPGLNSYKLKYGFKLLFGCGAYEYFLSKRFALAEQLLQEGRLISDISAELDYGSATTFIKEFKKRYGCTPGEWKGKR